MIPTGVVCFEHFS